MQKLREMLPADVYQEPDSGGAEVSSLLAILRDGSVDMDSLAAETYALLEAELATDEEPRP